MKINATIIKAGHSLVVVVPAEFTRKLGIRAGDPVRVQVDYEKGQAIYSFTNTRQLPLV